MVLYSRLTTLDCLLNKKINRYHKALRFIQYGFQYLRLISIVSVTLEYTPDVWNCWMDDVSLPELRYLSKNPVTSAQMNLSSSKKSD